MHIRFTFKEVVTYHIIKRQQQLLWTWDHEKHLEIWEVIRDLRGYPSLIDN
jgi:hypothetical protein